jgi:hypothetical protein
VAYGVPVVVVGVGWFVRELARRRAGGLEPAPVPAVSAAAAVEPAGTVKPAGTVEPVTVGTAVAASSAFAAPITVITPASAPVAEVRG